MREGGGEGGAGEMLILLFLLLIGFCLFIPNGQNIMETYKIKTVCADVTKEI